MRIIYSSTSRLLAAAALFLAACDSQPIAPANDASVPVPFEIGPDAAVAARTATMRGSHKLATVQSRIAAPSGNSGIQADVVSSPFDLTLFGGVTVHSGTSYNVYVNCATTPTQCWGSNGLSPASFLTDLNLSDFIRVANQYLGSDAKGRFRVAELRTTATFTGNMATIDDIFTIIFSAVTATHASGYNSIYHVFLPEGTDMCIDATTCYSPDDFSTFVFCAFHGSVDFSPTLHVLFSVEPYQATAGCQIPGQTPHGAIDATASTLSHEFIETITDPDLDAWFNGLFGFEIADLCSAIGSNQRVGRHEYFIQAEYSNAVRGCTMPDPVRGGGAGATRSKRRNTAASQGRPRLAATARYTASESRFRKWSRQLSGSACSSLARRNRS